VGAGAAAAAEAAEEEEQEEEEEQTAAQEAGARGWKYGSTLGRICCRVVFCVRSCRLPVLRAN
jgi:hypothetical protein